MVVGWLNITTSQASLTYPRTPAQHVPGSPVATPGGILSIERMAQELGSWSSEAI
jgi:hypothetical protein